MREIKFGGKRLDGGGWFYGDLLQAIYSDGRHTTLIMEQSPVALSFRVDPATVVQYTGFDDVNANKLYHKDIIEHQVYLHNDYITAVGVIEWHEKGYWYVADKNGKYVGFVGGVDLPEKIGTMVDNPELLEAV